MPPRNVPEELIRHGSSAALRESYSVTAEEATEFFDMGAVVNRSPFTVREDCPLARVHLLFTTMGLRHISVLDHNAQVTGIITRQNLLQATEEGLSQQSPMLEVTPILTVTCVNLLDLIPSLSLKGMETAMHSAGRRDSLHSATDLDYEEEAIVAQDLHRSFTSSLREDYLRRKTLTLTLTLTPSITGNSLNGLNVSPLSPLTSLPNPNPNLEGEIRSLHEKATRKDELATLR